MFRLVVYVSDVAFTKISYPFEVEPTVSGEYILDIAKGKSPIFVRVDNKIAPGQCPYGLVTYFFKVDDDELLLHLCEPSNRGVNWAELR